jgi:hypothetical protein
MDSPASLTLSGQGIFFLHIHPDWSCGPPSLFYKGIGFFPKGKAATAKWGSMNIIQHQARAWGELHLYYPFPLHQSQHVTECGGLQRRVTTMSLLTRNFDSSTAVRFPRPIICGSLRDFSFSSSSSSSPSSFRKMPTFFILFFNGVRTVAGCSYKGSRQPVNSCWFFL